MNEEREVRLMSITIMGVVKNGVVVPKSPLPEGARVEIHLVPIEGASTNPLLNFHGHLDPNDPLEIEFREELARLKREDLERTLREYDQECPNSSSIPTT
jgi:hypothetical protein